MEISVRYGKQFKDINPVEKKLDSKKKMKIDSAFEINEIYYQKKKKFVCLSHIFMCNERHEWN